MKYDLMTLKWNLEVSRSQEISPKFVENESMNLQSKKNTLQFILTEKNNNWNYVPDGI